MLLLPKYYLLYLFRIDYVRDRARLKIFIPQLQMESLYTMQGRILLMPIAGSGTSVGNYSKPTQLFLFLSSLLFKLSKLTVIYFLADIDATVTIQGEKIETNGEKYFNIKDFIVNFDIGHASVHLNDLFGGDRELGWQ